MQIILQRGLPQLSIAEGSNHQTRITTEQRAEKGITYETFTSVSYTHLTLPTN